MSNDKRYVLVIKSEQVAFGPFPAREDAEYAALDYYGTAVTGASALGDFLVAELRGPGGMADRERARHVAALMATDA